MSENTNSNVISFADERLVRQTPDHPLPLSDDDFAYIETCLAAVVRVFPPSTWRQDAADLPVRLLPGRTLARRLTTLRRSLRPTNAEQRLAHGMLWGALGLLNTASAMTADQGKAQQSRAPQECNGAGNILNL